MLSMPDALARFHACCAGASARVFQRGMLEDGCTSYQRLADAVSPGVRVLDLACGDGALIAILREAGHDVTGLDRSSDELAAARRRLGPELPLHHGEAQALPFEDGSFDAVTCHMAFMLMERPAEVVAEVGRVLVPGGLFAGVVSAAGPKTELMRAVFQALSAAQLADGLEIDWSGGVHGADGLAGVLPGWSLRCEPLVLTVRVPRDELWPFLRLAYYSAGLLSTSTSATLEVEVARLAAELVPEGDIPWHFGMLLFDARRQ